MTDRSGDMKGYPIGEQDFKSLRDMDCVYVDKTRYIHKLIDYRSKYFFLARPRRFGKSLFLSTLGYFFEGQRELFKGLYIDSIPWDWEEYPVLHLDLNTDRYAEKGQLDIVADEFFKKWEKKYGVETVAENLSSRFRNIIEAAHEKTGRQVVILVDEYDKPLVGNLNKDDNFEHYRAILSSLYSNFKSSAPHIRLVFLTGVSRFSKLSVFSDLNNLNDITFEDEFADICGITEEEILEYFNSGIAELAAHINAPVPMAYELLKRNYDGYRFACKGSDIYNPWSMLNCLQKKRIGNFWNQTGMPTIIAEALRKIDADLESILNSHCEQAALEGLDLSNPDPLALLYQTGYLTIKDYDREADMFTLGLPNKEVTDGLFRVLLPYYVKVRQGSTEGVMREIIRYIMNGQPEELLKSLNAFLAGIPYEMKMDNENNFQNAIYILLTLIGVKAETEVHTSDGRIDLLIRTSRYIYIMEIKFDHDSMTALRQIKEKEYHLPFLGDPRKIFLIGFNFSSSTRRIEDPVIEEILPES